MRVGNPPVFNSELEDVFLSLMIDRIFAKTAALDKREMFADVPFLKKKLPLSDFLGCKELRAEKKILLRKVDSFFDVCAK